jgi:3-oxoacyl-[acyl-carrier protein] reductase
MNNLLLFGASGAIGNVIKSHFLNNGWNITAITRKKKCEDSSVYFDHRDLDSYKNLSLNAPYNAICFAQGANNNDSIYDFDINKHLELYEANCLFVISALQYLLQNNLLAENAKICVISSIWQEFARQNKLSYSMSKAALSGLINSASIDLGKDGYLINAVLPGVLDTPMTHKNLGENAIQNVLRGTLFNSLPKIENIASLTYYLCSSENNSITGQSIAVDLGFCNAKII